MSDHTTAGWQELSRALGKDAVAAILAEPPDDTFGWGATLEQMWREPAHPSGLLLLGLLAFAYYSSRSFPENSQFFVNVVLAFLLVCT